MFSRNLIYRIYRVVTVRERSSGYLALLCNSCARSWFCHTKTGEIDVSVTDASDALVGGAHVVIKGSDTGAVSRTLDTNASGLASIPLLNPGMYDVTVEKEGFKTLVRKRSFFR